MRKLIGNRYEILKKIGSGAMGDVYEALDLKDSEFIAVKVLSRDTASSEAVQRFKREFKLLTELHHPNLCSVHDFGTLKDGRSYYTTEYIDGKNIFAAAKDLPHEKIYPWVVQLCRALEYMHSKGLIHYDIKPNNVLVQQVGSSSIVKLMDFGLAGENQIKGGGLIKGTIPYIAPEVLKGLIVDHRADLYSLGVLLYEIFTKQLFHIKGKTSFIALFKLSQELVAVLPSELAPNIPKKLEHLVMKLISFEPSQRFSRANEVITAVNKISRKKYALETEKTLEGYLMSSKLVGRDREMNLLKSLFENMRKGESKVVLITGEPGIGKSRLLNEFKVFVQLERSHCFSGAAHKDRTTVLELFHDVFSELINYLKEDRVLPRELKFSLGVLFRVFPDLAVNHPYKKLPDIAPLEPNAEKIRIFEALSELIRYLALKLGEVVILLEDLHLADDLTIQFLEYLGRNLEDKHVLVCGTARKEELQQNPLFKHAIANLLTEGALNQIELKPLNLASLHSFLDSTITSDSNSPELVKYLMERTSGNPFFVEEILRTLIRKRGISVGEKIAVEDFSKISLPRTIEGLVSKDLEDLDNYSVRIVKYAAVLLKDFDYDLMKQLTDLDDTKLSKALWGLRTKRILAEESGKYHFYHPTMRDAILGRLEVREKRRLNYQTGTVIEEINLQNPEKVVEDLAHYFINANDRKKIIEYGPWAAKKSSDQYANEQAISFYKSTLSFMSNKTSKNRFDILTKLAKIEEITGCHADAIKHYSKALKLKTAPINSVIRIFLALGFLFELTGAHNTALRLFRKCQRRLEEMRSHTTKTVLRATIYARICAVYYMKGDHKNVKKFESYVVQALQNLKNHRCSIDLLSNLYNALGRIEFYFKQDFRKAVAYYKKAYRYMEREKNEQSRIAALLSNLAVGYYYDFDFQKSFYCYQKSMRISESIGDQLALSFCANNLGLLFSKTGDYSKALTCCRRALAIADKSGNRLIQGSALSGLGDIYLKLCNYKNTQEYHEKSLNIFSATGRRDKEAHQLKLIADVRKAVGDYGSAFKYYKKSLDMCKGMGGHLGDAELFVGMGSTHWMIGNLSEANRFALAALKSAAANRMKDVQIDCHIVLGRINSSSAKHVSAKNNCKIGMKICQEIGMMHELLQIRLLLSEISYQEEKYSESIRMIQSIMKAAKEMGTKDLYIEALLLKAKNGTKLGVLPKLDAIRILDEAKKIAEEIGNPELQRKVYFEYGRFLQENKDYFNALRCYKECLKIMKKVSSRIKNMSYQKSYLNRSDQLEVFTAIKTIKNLI